MSLGTGGLEDAIASGFSMKSNRIRSVISRKKSWQKADPKRLKSVRLAVESITFEDSTPESF